MRCRGTGVLEVGHTVAILVRGRLLQRRDFLCGLGRDGLPLRGGGLLLRGRLGDERASARVDGDAGSIEALVARVGNAVPVGVRLGSIRRSAATPEQERQSDRRFDVVPGLGLGAAVAGQRFQEDHVVAGVEANRPRRVHGAVEDLDSATCRDQQTRAALGSAGQRAVEVQLRLAHADAETEDGARRDTEVVPDLGAVEEERCAEPVEGRDRDVLGSRPVHVRAQGQAAAEVPEEPPAELERSAALVEQARLQRRPVEVELPVRYRGRCRRLGTERSGPPEKDQRRQHVQADE